jgi:hypothetical protein
VTTSVGLVSSFDTGCGVAELSWLSPLVGAGLPSVTVLPSDLVVVVPPGSTPAWGSTFTDCDPEGALECLLGGRAGGWDGSASSIAAAAAAAAWALASCDFLGGGLGGGESSSTPSGACPLLPGGVVGFAEVTAAAAAVDGEGDRPVL